MTELEARRKALALESDVYRETLKLHIQNLQLYGQRARQRFTSGPSNSWLMLVAPLIGAFIGRRKLPKVRLVTGVIFAWKLLQKVRAVFPTIFKRRKRHQEEPASAI